MHVHVGKLQGREGPGSEGRAMLGAGLGCLCAVSGWELLGGHLLQSCLTSWFLSEGILGRTMGPRTGMGNGSQSFRD